MAVPHRACLGASRQIHDANNVALPDVVRWVGSIQKYRFVTIRSANSNPFHVAPLSQVLPYVALGPALLPRSVDCQVCVNARDELEWLMQSRKLQNFDPNR